MTLGAQVVDLVGLDVAQDPVERRRVVQIRVVEEQTAVPLVRILMMVEAPRVEGGGAPDQPVDLVSLREKELGEIAAVLARDSCDECTRSAPSVSSLSEASKNHASSPIVDSEDARARTCGAPSQPGRKPGRLPPGRRAHVPEHGPEDRRDQEIYTPKSACACTSRTARSSTRARGAPGSSCRPF